MKLELKTCEMQHNPHIHCPICNIRGFTLFEIIGVLIIISILGAVAVNRVWNPSVDLLAETELLKSHLRYAQGRAMNTNRIWGVHLSGNSCSLFKNGNVADMVLFPGEQTTVRSLSSGITVETAVISFDSWGIPHTDAAASDGQELTSGDGEAEITVSSTTDATTIIITPNTGFIP